MINEYLKEILQKAFVYAKDYHHEYLTVEHIFLILLDDKIISDMLDDLGIDIKYSKNIITKHISENIPILPKGIKDEPIQSVLLVNTIQDMVTNIQNSGRSQAGIEDMFVSILKNEQSYCTYILRKQGLERVDLLEEISHAEQYEEYDEDEEFVSNVLEQSSVELVSLAKDGKIDKVIGREQEIDRLVHILNRVKKNNPILVGEPGVGKTAIVEGLSLKIANDEIPSLKDYKVYLIDVSSIVAGTKYRGDFENKIKQLLKEIMAQDNTIMFIDEIHTIIGAGSASGSSMDISNILKPLLSSGKLRCIGATTYEEYRTDFSKDKALNRRFGKIDIKEPTKDECIAIIEGLKPKYEKAHKVKYSLKIISYAVDLSTKFINDRFLPDSAIDVIDEAGALRKIRNKSNRYTKIGIKDIENIVSSIGNIPTKTTTSSDRIILKTLDYKIKQKIFGQDEAIKQLVRSIRINKAGLSDDDKPIGSFLLTGPTGVGKTELCKELSNQLGINFERFDMSEYSEAHTISRLIGAPAGYVGYEKGGLLSEAIKKKPYTLLLLDEVEKAHKDLMNILLQIMDNAILTDNNGVKINFKNVILILTSNLGSNEAGIMGFAKDGTLNIDKSINDFFRPEFRNRLDGIIKFNPLAPKVMFKIVTKFIGEINNNLAQKNINITLSNKTKSYLCKKGYDKILGARPLQRVIKDEIKEPLSKEILFGKLRQGGDVSIEFEDNKLKFRYK